MSVGVFPLMQQLFIVYGREKYKIYSSLRNSSQHKLVCRLELYTPCAYTCSAPAPNVVSFSRFQMKFMAEK